MNTDTTKAGERMHQSKEVSSIVIRKPYMSLAQVECAQNKLYNQYNSVKLIESPRFAQSGWYAWRVS